MTFRKMFKAMTKNWTAKLFCFAIAIVLVLFNRMSSMEERVLSVPFRIYSNPEFVTISEVPKSIKVSIRGNRDDIYTILNDDLSAYADFRDISNPGNHERAIKVDKSGNALYMNPLEIYVNPVKLNILAEYKRSKKVDVKPVFKGALPEGLEVSGCFLSAEKVLVEGPESVIEKMSYINTSPVSLDGRSDDFSVAVSFDNKNHLVKVSSPDIKLSVNVAHIMVVKNIAHISISLLNCPSDFTALSNVLTGSIKLEMESMSEKSLKPADVKLTVDLSKIAKPGVYKLPVVPDLPENVSLISLEPETVEVTVTAAEIAPNVEEDR